MAHRHYKKLVQTSVLLPSFISWVIIGGLMLAILSPNSGVLQAALEWFGYRGRIVNLMASKEPRQLVQIYEMVDAARTLLFASDYPHFDADEPGCLPRQLGPEVLERIYWRNALELFALEEDGAVTAASAAAAPA